MRSENRTGRVARAVRVNRNINRGRSAVALMSAAAAAVVCSTQLARAATLNWDPGLTSSAIGGGAGTWNLSTGNWFDSSIPGDRAWTDTAGATDTAVFGGTAGAVTLGDNLGALGLSFGTAGYTVTGANTLTLGAGGITVAPVLAGTTSIGAPISLSGNQSWTVGPASSLVVSGSLSGSSTVTKAGTGTLTLSGNNSSDTGGVSISAGQLNINNANALAAGTFTIGGGIIDNTSGAAITIAGNNAITLNNNFTFLGSSDLNLGTGTASTNASRTITVKGGNLTFGGQVNLNATATGHNLTKAGVGTLTLQSGADAWDNTIINGGVVDIGTTGTIGTTQLTLSNGELTMSGSRAVSVSSSVSPGAGRDVLTLNAPAGQPASFTGGTLGTRSVGMTGLYRGTQLGTAAPNTTAANILFSTAPTPTISTTADGTLAFTAVGTGTLNTTQAAVLRGVLADTSATGTGAGLATYDPTNGVRLLNGSEQTVVATGAAYTATAAGDNVRINNTTGITITGKQTNTLQLDNTSGSAMAITNSGTALNATNGLLFSGSSAITLSGGSMTVTTGANAGDLLILSTNTAGVTLGVNLANSGTGAKNFTFGGPGNISFSGTVSTASNGGENYTGPGTVTLSGSHADSSNGIQVYGGTVKLASGFAWANSRPFKTANGATFDVNGISVSNVDFLADLNGVGGTVTNSSATTATLTISNGSSSGGNSSFSGVITGPINLVMGSGTSTAVATQTLSGNSTYTGTTSVIASQLKLGVTNALPTGTALTVSGTNTAAATTLDLVGNNQTVASLAGTLAASTTATITNSATGASALIVSGSANTSYAGLLNDGGAGKTLALVRAGTGSLSLSNGGSTFSGGTQVLGGSLFVNNTSGSGLGAGAVTVGGTGKLGGTGLITGAVTLNGGGHVSPGIASGSGSTISTGFTLGGLTFNSGSVADLDLAAGGVSDTLVSTNGLSIAPSTGVNLFQSGTANPFGSNGTYNLFQVTGGSMPTVSALQSNFSILNPVAGGTYTWGESGQFVTLTISGLATVANWTNASGSTWNLGTNWSTNPTVPGGAAGDAVIFGSALTSSGQVTLDGSRTVGALTFNNASASYEIAQGTGGSLVINGGVGSGSISDTAGSHLISAPVVLNSNTSVSVTNATDTLTISGNITGSSNLSVGGGAGTVLLTGTNSYGTTSVAAGNTLQVGNGGTSGTLGTGAVAVDGTLAFNRSDSITIANNISGAGTVAQLGSGTTTLSGANSGTWGASIQAGTLAINRSDATAINGPVTGTGALTMSGGGTLTLGSSNAGFSGPVTVTGSALNLGADAAAGTGPITLDTSKLTENNVSTTSANAITVTNANTIDTFGSKTMTLTGAISGSGSITRNGGTGLLTLSGNNAGFTGSFSSTSGGVTFNGNKASGSSSAQWSFTGSGATTLTNMGGTINFGSLSGSSALTGSGNAARVRVGDYNVAGVYPNTTYSGVISAGSGGIGLAKSGKGSLTLSGQNKFAVTQGVTFNDPTAPAYNVVVIDGSLIAGASTTGATSGPFGGTGAIVLLGGSGSLNGLTPGAFTGGAFQVDNPIVISGGNDTTTPAAGFVASIGGTADANSSFTGAITLQENLTVSQAATTGGNALTLASNISGTAAGTGTSPGTTGVAGSSAITNSVNNTGTQVVTFAGPGAINATGVISNGTGTVGVAASGGSTILSAANTYTGNTTVNGGTLTVAAAGSLASSNLTANTGGTLNLNGAVPTSATINATGGTVNFPGNPVAAAATPRVVGAVNVGSGGLAKITASAFPATPAILQVTGVTFADNTAKLDLTNNELLTNDSLATVRADVANGSLKTSTAGLGVGTLALGGGQVEARATLLGDTNLDGSVDVTDLGNLASSYGATSGAVWVQGDTNYDNAVDVTDLGNLASSYGGSLASGPSAGASAMVANSMATVASSGTAAVPEPATFGLLGVGALGLLSGRRRRRVR